MNSINLNPEALQQIVAKTLFDSIDPAERERILTGAIASLLEPQEVTKRSGYGTEKGPSRLEQAFQNAASAAANQIARDRVANDPSVTAAIDGIITEAVAKLAEAGMRERIATKIAEQIIDGIRLRD